MTAPADQRGPSLAERAQSWALGSAAIGLLLGVMTGGGCSPLPDGPRALIWPGHLLLLALGVVAGEFTMRRRQELDRRRWQVASDPEVTPAERQHAHSETERNIRWAGTVLLAGALGPAFWMAYWLRDPAKLGAADGMIVTPLLGFVIGMFLGSRHKGEGPEPGDEVR